MKKIIIDIRKDGTTKIEAVGFKGDSCEKATQPFEDLLGEVTDKELKNSYYEQDYNSLNANDNEKDKLNQF